MIVGMGNVQNEHSLISTFIQYIRYIQYIPYIPTMWCLIFCINRSLTGYTGILK